MLALQIGVVGSHVYALSILGWLISGGHGAVAVESLGGDCEGLGLRPEQEVLCQAYGRGTGCIRGRVHLSLGRVVKLSGGTEQLLSSR